jgi:hypothetical protein
MPADAFMPMPTFIDGILIFGASIFRFGAATLTDAVPPMPADAFMPMPTFIDGIVIFGAAILRFIDGILIFGASIFRLGAATLTDAVPPMPADAFMPMPTFIDGIDIFGASILRLGAAMLIFAPPETFAVISILPSRPPYLKLQLPVNLLPKY